MSNSQPTDHEPLPPQIAAEAIRERSSRQGSSVPLHRWWARRPAVLARVATYLAITHERAPAADFLESLGLVEPSPATISQACLRIRDAAWHWSLRSPEGSAKTNELPVFPEPLRILDPFAGSGALPLEAARLGCTTYAGDLSPVSYLILRGTLNYPQMYGAPDSRLPGSDANHCWAGIASELRFWANRLEDRVKSHFRPLFPAVELDNDTKSSLRPLLPGFVEDGCRYADRYFWLRQAKCPQCNTISPLESSLALSTGNSNQCISVLWRNGQSVPQVLHEASPERHARHWNCPACSMACDRREVTTYEPPFLIACRVEVDDRHRIIPVLQGGTDRYAPWSPENAGRLTLLLESEFGKRLSTPLPNSVYQSVLRRGGKTFGDLFTQRQLLVGLEYVNGVREVVDEMRQTGIPPERVEALATYIAFFVGYLADRNSALCRWNAERKETGTTFDRPTVSFPSVFVERAPFGMIAEWLDKIIPAIQSQSLSVAPVNVYLGDACHLPFAKDFFDAVVTDPPYYDNIAYSELTDFFWVWESAVLERASLLLQVPGSVPRPDEYLESKGIGSGDAYRRGMLGAFTEIFRTLKPMRQLCLFFSSKVSGSFQEYVDLCQEAGFEFVDVRSLSESVRTLQGSVDASSVTYLIYLRKPAEQQARDPLQVAKASVLLEAADAGRPVLYSALAELIAKELPEEDLVDLLLPGGRGSRIEQLMEVVAQNDPRDLLEKCFGRAGIRRIAVEVGSATMTPSSSPIEVLLAHFGFAIPSPSRKFQGVTQVRDQLQRLAKRIIQADDLSEATGPFLDGCTSVERLLRVSIWGWARLLFGNNVDNHLLTILREEIKDPARHLDMDRLSFGHILALFRQLPDHVAGLPEAVLVERKFGRKHPYLPRNKKTKFAERLDELVVFRNKVEHNKDNYKLGTPIHQLREELSGVLAKAALLVVELGEAHAIPRVAEPFQEIRDKWNRMTYRLSLDDGSDCEAQFSEPLSLGKSYLYFGGNVNPTPVDPPVLQADELGEIP
jgi:putative DNA methylase